MDDNKLRNLLQEVHDEINNTQSVDEKGSELLSDLEGDIRGLLERSGETPVDVHPSVIEDLEHTLFHFEVSHPGLTTLITKLLDSLSNAGI